METTLKIKKITATIIAIVFCAVCCLMPINRYKQAKAAEIGTLMLASSVLLSLYMIGIHTDSSGVTNFEHVANAIQEQYRKDFVYENYQNMVTGEPETRVGQLYNMWQEGVIDISSNAWASFKQWAYDRAVGVFDTSFGAFTSVGEGKSLPFVSSSDNDTILYYKDGNVINGGDNKDEIFSNIYIRISSHVENNILPSNYIINSNGTYYFIASGESKYHYMNIVYRNYTSGGPSGSGQWSRTTYNGISYITLPTSSTCVSHFPIESTTMTVTEYIDYLLENGGSVSAPSFELSLDQNTVYNQVKAVADREIGQATTQDLLDKAKYLNDAIGQHTKDGSNLVNLRDGTIPFQGDADATADAILSGDISVPEIQQSLGIDTTVQGQVITDTATPTYEIATPSDIATSVPLVVNPSLTVIEPQEYTYPDRYGGDFSFPLSNYFPFCLPFDAVRIFKMVNGSPQAPQISFNANSIFGGYFKNYNHGSDGDLVKIRGDTVTLDLAAFNTVAMICRVMMYLLFLVGVCFGIRNWIHGGD